MRLVLVGSGHVFDLAASLRPLIHSERPTVVALELDRDRFHGLQARRAGHVASEEEKRRVPRMYRMLTKFQESVASSFGVQPGEEMLVAADAGRDVGASIALIDRNAQDVVREVVRQMKWREKGRFIWMGVRSMFHRQDKASVEAEIRRYQADPEAYLNELGHEFPTIRRILIDERNEHMGNELRRLASFHERIVAVVGDGHVPGLAKLVQDLTPALVRLQDLRSMKPAGGLEWRHGPGALGFSFSGESLEGGLSRD